MMHLLQKSPVSCPPDMLSQQAEKRPLSPASALTSRWLQAFCVFVFLLGSSLQAAAQRQMENLGRAVVAVRTNPSEVFISWRVLGTDPQDIAFNLYRGDTKINDTPISGATNFTDQTDANATYSVRPVIAGQEQAASAPATVWTESFKRLPLQRPAGGTTPDGVAYTYSPNDCSVGDVDGDGEYEIIVKWDPSNAKDNSQAGYTGNVYLDAYKMDGTHLWRIDLGKNIRAGAHYTQFIVYDLDGDGKAELACKTADGTVDGAGTVIGNPDVDYRNAGGWILHGPEFLTVFNGQTGAAMATTDYVPARGNVSSWGDDYGNRVDRFLAGVGYFDGQRPSLLFTRGYYTRSVLVAWDWRGGQLTQRWVFDSNAEGNGAYAGQGNHSLSINDVDGDGKDEVVFGSMAIDDDGTGLYSTGLGHGDAQHVGDLDPDRPGLESWSAHEDASRYEGNGLWMRDAGTGEKLWGVPTTGDIGRAMTADIDPNYKGYEAWGPRGGLYTAKGVEISTARPGSMNFGNWWDGDLQRELLDGTVIDKWNYTSSTQERLLSAHDFGAERNNGTKASPGLTADILGDWREEVIYRHTSGSELLIFTTTAPTTHKFYTFMHDAQYRAAVAWQNVGYNQPPHTSFYVGEGMATPPTPNIALVADGGQTAPAIYLTARGGDAKAYLGWSTNNFEMASLEIYRNTSADSAGRTLVASLSGTVKAYEDTGLTNGTTYYYWIKGADANGVTVTSAAANATPDVIKLPPPPVIVELAATAGEGKVDLSWTTKNVNIQYVEIFRDTDSNPNGRVRIGTVAADVTTFTDGTVTSGTPYWYWLKVIDLDGKAHGSNGVQATPTGAETQKVLVTFKVDMTGADASKGVFITGSFEGAAWKILPMTAEGNNIYSWSIIMTSNATGAYYFLNGPNWSNRETVPLACAPMWNVDRGYDIAVSKEYAFKWSSCEKIVPAPKTVMLSATGTDRMVDLSWTIENIDGIRAMEVFRDTDANPSGRARIASLSANTRTYTDTGVENGKTYWYWIKVTDASSVTNSNSAEATPMPLDGTYILTALHSGKVLDVNKSCSTNGGNSNVVQRTAGATNQQQWTLSSVGEGYYSITNTTCGQALGVKAQSSTAEGANIAQWTYDGSAKQQWELIRIEKGYYKLINKHSGQAITVEDASTAEGANVKQWSYADGKHQQFSLSPLTAESSARLADTAEPAAQTLIYPNPSQQEFRIQKAGSFEYTIIDQLGRTVERGKAEGSVEAGGNLKPGLYIINLQSVGIREQFKLIKK